MGGMSPQQRKVYDDHITRLRQMVNTTPRFEVRQVGDETVIVDSRLGDDGVVLRVEPGVSAPAVVRFFQRFGHYVFIDLLGLLEAAPGTRAESKAAALLARMHFEQEDDGGERQG